MNISESTRHWIYTIVAAVIALLAAYGVLGPDEVPLWLALAAAVLGVGTNVLAAVNTRKLPPPPPPGE